MDAVVNIYRKNTSNTGDKFSTPTKYFDYLQNVETLDFTELSLKEFDKAIKDKVIIFGGGGFVAQDYFKDYMKVLINADTKLLIGWGIGHNVHGGCKILYEEYRNSDRFDLLGVRDSTSYLEWVPCSSCMHTIFDKKFEINNQIVVYEHKNFPMKDFDNSYPMMKNSDSFEEIINFLGSAELVITNSYHGAYWATLLNRKVIILQPFSSKFFGFHHPLIVSNTFDIRMISSAPTYQDALSEAREANINFSRKVESKIGRL